jgi:hypothetical protein
MASTRFFNDNARIAAYLELQTNAGRYALNVPGNGENLPYFEDVHMRLQRWGANLDKNAISIEDELRGMNRPLVRKDAFIHVYTNLTPTAAADAGMKFSQKYSTSTPFTDETRATHPAWEYREMEQPRWETPFINPQANTEIRFPNKLSTRILEKDAYRGFQG